MVTNGQLINCTLLSDYAEDELHYTCLKLYEGGYLNAMLISTLGFASPMIARVQDLTFKGHEFIETIRPKPIYNKAKSKIASTVGSASLEILSSVASSIATKMLGIN